MKIVTLTDDEEKVIAKMRRDALKAKAEPDAAAREVVRAAGTSEGAKKGWQNRSHKYSDGSGQLHNTAFGLNDSKEENKAYHTAQKEIIKHGHNNYTDSIPVQEHADILEKHGFSGKGLDGIYTGREGRADAQVGPNTFHHMSWYKMPSGRYETTAYLSHGKSLGGEWKHEGEESNKASDATSTDVIHCRASSAAGEKLGASAPWKQGERVEFMWMPSGVSTICAGFRKGSIELTVQCDEKTVEAVQASLDAWREDRPKQEPFGCIEHREQEASFRVSASGGFKWNGDGVYLAAEPTTLGAENVNGRVHRSWSPSFTTDADYSKAKEVDGVLQFPEGVRGSQSNPARITGVDFCVGTLTNKPAFHSMNPVRAKQGDASVEMAKPPTPQAGPPPARERYSGELRCDVPDYTESELTCYMDLLQHGRSHMEAVDTIKLARNLGSTKAAEKSTLDSVYSKHAEKMAAINAIAEKNGAVRVTMDDIYDRYTVTATWSDAARQASAEKRKHEGWTIDSSTSKSGTPSVRITTPSGELHHMFFDNVDSAKDYITNKNKKDNSNKSKASDQTAATILKRIYARAGANR